jgi:aminobenzoyl-glutamate utilization protein A
MNKLSYLPEDSITIQYPEAVKWRRKLHQNAQSAWLEFYATAFVAEKLADWGYDLKLGRDIIATDHQLLPPDEATLKRESKRAIAAGAIADYVAKAAGGFTGVVATISGPKPGPTIGFRFDIDSNDVTESTSDSHRPFMEGFLSNEQGYAHLCGHDVHTAMGLLLAKYFSDNRDKIQGKIKFIFQPNEENMSGALAMAEKGVVDDLDYLFGGHVGLNITQTGHIAVNVHSFLALSRFEVTFSGRSAHAAVRPEDGKNALLGACAAITNLYAIARHSSGASRINVGVVKAGDSWNVIPDKAYFWLETRGETNEINDYMVKKAKEVLAGAASMYDLECDIKPAATGLTGKNDPELVDLATTVAEKLPSVLKVWPEVSLNASEDCTVFMDRVQSHGGKALFAVYGTPTYGGHHHSQFDVDERVIQNGAEFLSALYHEVLRTREHL